MFEMKKKRVRLTMEEKLWVVSHHEKNPKITQAKIGLDFSAKFIRPISRQCVCNIIQQHSFGRHSQGLGLVNRHGFECHG